MNETVTTSIREPAAPISKAMTKSIMKQQGTIKTKQQLLAKEVFCPHITKFRGEKIKPLYKVGTLSADLIDKSSFSNYNNSYKFIKLL